MLLHLLIMGEKRFLKKKQKNVLIEIKCCITQYKLLKSLMTYSSVETSKTLDDKCTNY